MNDEQLFEWDVAPKRKARSTNREQELVPRPAGYHAVTNRSGPKMARHGSVVTLCGILGRRLDAYPRKIPLCEECERMFHAE